MLAYYELAYKVDSTGDLQAILEANVEDACKWVRAHDRLVCESVCIRWIQGPLPGNNIVIQK